MSDAEHIRTGAQTDEKSVTEQVSDFREQLADGYHEMEDTLLTTRDQAYELNRKAVEFIRERPGTCLVGAFAVGFVIGKLAQKRWFV